MGVNVLDIAGDPLTELGEAIGQVKAAKEAVKAANRRYKAALALIETAAANKVAGVAALPFGPDEEPADVAAPIVPPPVEAAPPAPVDPCSLHDWRDTPLGAKVIKTKSLRDALKAAKLRTLGDVDRAVPEGSTIPLALEGRFSPAELSALCHDLDVWSSQRGWLEAWKAKRPYEGFPLDKLAHDPTGFVRVEEVRAEEPAPAVELPPAKPAGPGWWNEWDHTTCVMTPAGADYVHARYKPDKFNAGRGHYAFRGPVSETGYYSHFADVPGPDVDCLAYTERLSRFVARIHNGLDVLEPKGPAAGWRSAKLNLDNLPGLRKRLGMLRTAGFRTVGDVVDQLELIGDGAPEKVTGPAWKETTAAVEAFRAGQEKPAPAPIAEPEAEAPADDEPAASPELVADYMQQFEPAAPAADPSDMVEDDEPAPKAWTTIDRELFHALNPQGDPIAAEAWTKAHASGIGDPELLEEIGCQWPERRPTFEAGVEDGCTIQGGDWPKFWVGMLDEGKLPKPDLEGDELAKAARRVLELPYPKQPTPDGPRPDGPAPDEKPRTGFEVFAADRFNSVSGRGEFLGVVEAPSCNAAVGAAARAFPELAATGYVIGDEVPIPPGPDVEDLEDAIHDALMPDGRPLPWKDFRNGATDGQLLEAAGQVWGDAVAVYHPGAPAGLGLTTFGGSYPTAWVGDRTGPGPRIKGAITGDELATIIRKRLRIPRVDVPQHLPGRVEAAPPKSKAKGRKAKPAGGPGLELRP
jgi:hypothetical protein